MGMKVAVALALMFGATHVAYSAWAPSADTRTERPAEPSWRLAQQYSTKCQSSAGICLLPSPQEVGTACQCGDFPGTVIP
jgi:hypothetical protein